MEIKCNDPIFGEMSYKHGWFKNQSIFIFGKNWDIKILAKAFSQKAINAAEQNAYKNFMENETKFIEIAENQLKEYVNNNLYELSEYWVGARRVKDIIELAQMVTPKSLVFKQDGSIIMLLDCVWDVENGVGVKLIPDVSVASQDIFL